MPEASLDVDSERTHEPGVGSPTTCAFRRDVTPSSSEGPSDWRNCLYEDHEGMTRMDRERAWTYFIDGLTMLWVGLFCVSLAVDFGLVSLAPSRATAIDRFLRVAVFAFLADVCLAYWRSEKGVIGFTRSNWFLVVTSVPWFRPLRALRLGRGLRALRALSRSRRVASLLNKLRRAAEKLRDR